MGHGHPGLGNQVAHFASHLIDVLDPVVYEEDLTLAQQFPTNGLSDWPLVIVADVSEDGLAVGRRRVEQTEVANPGERHLQCARNGRGRQSQHVDVGSQLLDRLLVANAEPLLFVDHQ